MEKCFLCEKKLKGLGHYQINYLSEYLDLCGSCMQRLYKTVKESKQIYEIYKQLKKEGKLDI